MSWVTTRILTCGSAACLLFLTACDGSNDGGGFGLGGGLSPPPAPSNSLRLQPLSSVLTAPVFLTAPPGDLNRLFVVEQGGLIKILNSLNGTPRPNPFLDVSTLITSDVATAGERGLLGMAFDPIITGRFYIYYTDTNGDIVIARYLVSSSNVDLADTSSAFILKTINHRANSNNYGGMLAFGPDGCLYAGTGDGGGSGDPANNAQTTTSLLGKILRLDPNTGNACTLVTSNPFASGGGAAEVWSWGLRNPWRFSFDRTTGDLYIGDVGQNCREEVDVGQAPNGGRNVNFGWRLAEGFTLFDPNRGPNNCPGSTTPPHTPPVLDYTHDPDTGACSITGGYVYRGTVNPAATGRYFYADFCAGFVRSFQLQNGAPGSQNTWPLLSPPGNQITSFGEDARGELYLLTLAGGLFHVVAN